MKHGLFVHGGCVTVVRGDKRKFDLPQAEKSRQSSRKEPKDPATRTIRLSAFRSSR